MSQKDMSASLGTAVQLMSHAPQDRYLTGPDHSLWDASAQFKTYGDFDVTVKSTQAVTDFRLGQTNTFDVPNAGDVLGECILEITVPAVQPRLGEQPLASVAEVQTASTATEGIVSAVSNAVAPPGIGYFPNEVIQLHPAGQGLTSLDAQRFTVFGPQGAIRFNGPGVASIRIRKHGPAGTNPYQWGNPALAPANWLNIPWKIVYRYGDISMPNGVSTGWSQNITLQENDIITIRNGANGFSVSTSSDPNLFQHWFDIQEDTYTVDLTTGDFTTAGWMYVTYNSLLGNNDPFTWNQNSIVDGCGVSPSGPITQTTPAIISYRVTARSFVTDMTGDDSTFPWYVSHPGGNTVVQVGYTTSPEFQMGAGESFTIRSALDPSAPFYPRQHYYWYPTFTVDKGTFQQDTVPVPIGSPIGSDVVFVSIDRPVQPVAGKLYFVGDRRIYQYFWSDGLEWKLTVTPADGLVRSTLDILHPLTFYNNGLTLTPPTEITPITAVRVNRTPGSLEDLLDEVDANTSSFGRTVGNGSTGSVFCAGAGYISYIYLGGNMRFSNTPFYWDVWAYVTDPSVDTRLVTQDSELQLGVANGKVLFHYATEAYDYIQYYGNTGIAANTWTHLAISGTGNSTSTGNLYAFVNGVQQTLAFANGTSVGTSPAKALNGNVENWSTDGISTNDYFTPTSSPFYVSDFRLVRGKALTESFTPPEFLTPEDSIESMVFNVGYVPNTRYPAALVQPCEVTMLAWGGRSASWVQRVGTQFVAQVTPTAIHTQNDTWASPLALSVMRRARMYVGEILVHDDERLWYHVLDRLRLGAEVQRGAAEMLGAATYPVMSSPTGPSMGRAWTLYLPFKFMCCSDARGQREFLPTYREVPVRVEFEAENVSSLIPVSTTMGVASGTWTATLLTNHMRLSASEVSVLATRPWAVMYETFQDADGQNYVDGSNVTSSLVSISLRELTLPPIRFLSWLMYLPDGSQFQYMSETPEEVRVLFDGIDRQTGHGGLFAKVQPWVRARRCDAVNDLGLMAFCVDLMSRAPSGALTIMDLMKDPLLKLALGPELSNTAVKVKVFAGTYNWLVFESRQVRQIFTV